MEELSDRLATIATLESAKVGNQELAKEIVCIMDSDQETEEDEFLINEEYDEAILADLIPEGCNDTSDQATSKHENGNTEIETVSLEDFGESHGDHSWINGSSTNFLKTQDEYMISWNRYLMGFSGVNISCNHYELRWVFALNFEHLNSTMNRLWKPPWPPVTIDGKLRLTLGISFVKPRYKN
ncbi:hypothetical protein CFOL_v3_23310 [Cephalotus follicularis]|uniref:Uncharacterized protein n=1 Tax=Cephalotus follicularis TaxID=3775 RepID=A0A1Q3CHZ6_CEPFO|nr:hypothetical protein CFOL_v3_23310 [Cephalotus follicularis]